jgi:hypothetical protein
MEEADPLLDVAVAVSGRPERPRQHGRGISPSVTLGFFMRVLAYAVVLIASSIAAASIAAAVSYVP